MNVFFEREVRKLCKDLEWEEVVLVLLGVLDGVNGEVYDNFKMSIEVYKDDKKKLVADLPSAGKTAESEEEENDNTGTI